MRNRRPEKRLQNLVHLVTQGSFLETNRSVSECAESRRDPDSHRLLGQAFRLYLINNNYLTPDIAKLIDDG